MRINRFVALATGVSRRTADDYIAAGRVQLAGKTPAAGAQVTDADAITLDGTALKLPATTTIILNKPVGYVVSRNGQGSRTIYELLPPELHNLKPVGRLDKDSSGLLLLTNDGELAQQLTHPSHAKEKVYEISLDKPLAPADHARLEQGVALEDGISHLQLASRGDGAHWQVSMHEGRNRQIRRTFAALGYTVVTLHRRRFGNYELNNLQSGSFRTT